MKSKYERYGVQIPAIVEKATQLAEELGFPLMPEGRPLGYKGPPSACIPEMGRLLSVLAAGYPYGCIAEYGTGAGVGTAWLVHGLSPHARLLSAELNEQLVHRVSELFVEYTNVEIRPGDCFEVLAEEMPFDLLFMDSGVRDYLVEKNWDEVIEMVKVGGKIVFDDLGPLELWPSEWDDLIDQKREFAFNNSRVVGTEVRITATQVAIIVTRIK
jgi:predicted O-methyltransferase YrrM